MNIDDDLLKKIKSMVHAKIFVKDIAAQCGVKPYIVLKIRKEMIMDGEIASYNTPITADEEKLLMQMYQQGETYGNIGKEINKSKDFVAVKISRLLKNNLLSKREEITKVGYLPSRGSSTITFCGYGDQLPDLSKPIFKNRGIVVL